MATKTTRSTRSGSARAATGSASRGGRSPAGGSKAGGTKSGGSKSGSSRAARTSKGSAGTKGASKGRSRGGSARTSPLRGVATAFEGHAADVSGLACLAIAIVAALGIYGDVAGPVGESLADGIGALVGRAAWVVPPALVAIGVRLLRGPREGGRSPARLVVGGSLLAVATCGLLHVASDQPDLDAGSEALGAAGGALGAAVAGPLVDSIAAWAAGAVLVIVGVLGLVILTAVPIRVAADRTAAGVAPVRPWLGHIAASLFRISSDPRGDDVEVAPAAPTRRRAPAGTASPDASPDANPDASPHVGPDVGPGPDPAPDVTPGDLVVVAGETDAVEEAVEDPARLDDDEAAASAVHLPEPDDEAGTPEQLAIDLGPAARQSPWKLPAPKLLERSQAQEVDRRLVEEAGRTLEKALADHGVETKLVGMVVGPTVTRFELELGAGVKVARVTSLHKDIAYAMASPDVRILAPIPGRQAIGIEVPNVRRQVVSLGDILASEEARRASNPLEVAIGRDINGKSILVDLATMPHVLIAGATGAGKSSCINSLITSVLMRTTPDQVRMILIDPKRVELGQYNRLPHLLTQVVTNPKKAANALSWAVREMERRYDLLSEVGFRDIGGYNAAYDRGELAADPDDPEAVEYQRLPYVLLVVDELNDLMMVAARDVEESICRIAQMARAVGIHLVIATQRPSVNVITGVIKANVPARLAFAVSSLADSRVILDQGGAERLVGKGDMLLLGPASSIPQRIQGCWVSEKEVRAVVGHWRRQAPEVAYVEGVEGSDDDGPGAGGMPGGSTGDADDDDMLFQAMELVVRSQLGSTSMLQRKLRVGFARAGRLMDLLEQRGVVGPSEGSKARAVLMTPEELDELLGGGAEP